MGTQRSFTRTKYLVVAVFTFCLILFTSMPYLPTGHAFAVGHSAASQLTPVAMTPDDASMLDLMVVWTPSAETAIGGADKMARWIDGMVLRNNMAFRNSGITTRLALTYKNQVAYTQVNEGTDLSNLKDGVGVLATVHAWRNTYHADLVLLVRSSDGGSAYQLSNVSTDSSESAYGVIRVSNKWSFPHELGHLMGSSHDWYTDGAGYAPYSYAHGQTSPIKDNNGTLFNDIMSYGGGGAFVPGGLYKILAYANPDLTYRGQPLGVPAGTKSNCTQNTEVGLCDADLRLTFNTTAPTVAQFRSSEVRWTGSVNTDWNNPNNWETTVGKPATPTVQAIVPRAIDNVVIPAGVSNYPVISGGTNTARNVTINNGASLAMSGGTLTVSGGWNVVGNGIFNGTGGTVVFNGSRDTSLPLQMSLGSSFHHLQIGDGVAMPWIKATSSLNVTGNMTLNRGSVFEIGANPMTLTGNWQDNGAGFDYLNSTVIFNGIGQTTNAVSSAVILSQDFSYRDGSSGSYNDTEPYGWENALGTVADTSAFWFFGDSGTGGIAKRHYPNFPSSSVDSWLFTHAVNLSAHVKYRLTFKYKVYDTNDPSNFAAWYGSHLLPSQMQTAIITVTNANNTNWNVADQIFNVPISRSYNLGIRNYDTSSQEEAYLDDIILTIEPVIPENFGTSVPKQKVYLPLVQK